MQGLWVHGNLLTSLPASIGDLSSLRAFSAVGNQLTSIPESIGSLQSLTSLELAANRLKTLPESVGRLGMAFHRHIPLSHVSLCRACMLGFLFG